MEALIFSAISTAITVCTIIYVNGKSSGRIQEWMKGHETLDKTRFDSVAELQNDMRDDIKELLKRR